MKYSVFAVHDIKAENFGMPVFFAAKGQAIRAFDDQCNAAESLIGQHPQDFTLYQIGEYDDSTGLLIPLPQPTPLGTGVDYVRNQPEE